MKKVYLFTFLTISFTTFSQERERSGSNNILRSELTSWDPIRGEWLASSIEAMAVGNEIPDRTFPEDFTPNEMWRIVPQGTRERINAGSPLEQFRNETNTSNVTVVQQSLMRDCKPKVGRTYGDPHMVSFDGATYSFQTVGEFVLARSNDGLFEVQTRQKPQSSDFSLNTAVAMNVAGDRLSIYAQDVPGSSQGNPVRLNGNPIQVRNATYYLPHGGTVRPESDGYLVSWPTGETARIQTRGSDFRFMNVTLNVYPCGREYDGLLGNANGAQNDDFDMRGVKAPASQFAFSSFGNQQLSRASDEMEKEYLAFLAKDFARAWRVTDMTSLFEYDPGENTLTFTDESFPRVHRTLNGLTPQQQAMARKKCEDGGVSREEIGGCIYDQAFLDIPPSPRPIVNDPTINYKPSRLERPELNINPPAEPMVKPEGRPVKGTIHPDLLKEEQKVKPSQGLPQNSTNPNPDKESEFKPNSGAEPVSKPSTTVPSTTIPSTNSKPIKTKPTKPVGTKPNPSPSPALKGKGLK
ncbi:MAG: hypothetical protein EP305_09600 [Bacteroidetes bacterium]|nr:MAG: hypothetical protein EP305_09600 [Bacteroidota bacterium]